MDANRRITGSHWRIGLVLGALTGFIVLGIGGRIAMRGIALHTGQPAGFSWGGSLTVVALGAVCGTGGGILLVLVKRLFRNRPIRVGVFWTVVALVTLRGLRPVDPVRLSAFLPLVVLYGTTLQLACCRMYRRTITAMTKQS